MALGHKRLSKNHSAFPLNRRAETIQGKVCLRNEHTCPRARLSPQLAMGGSSYGE
ncbi:hypothetical protein A2U01_0051397, partial [Trifolium medium]|nr:hypothetical protein [Trifolium medium]